MTDYADYVKQLAMNVLVAFAGCLLALVLFWLVLF